MTHDPCATTDNTLHTTLSESRQQRMSNKLLTQDVVLHSKTARQSANENNRMNAGVSRCVFLT